MSVDTHKLFIGAKQGHYESCSNKPDLTTNEVFLKQTTDDITSSTADHELSWKVVYSTLFCSYHMPCNTHNRFLELRFYIPFNI